MGYRVKAHTQEDWLRYCETRAAMIATMDLPPELFATQPALEQFLSTGKFAGAQRTYTLQGLSGNAFMALEQFIVGSLGYDEQYSAFFKERLRRFKVYGS